MEADEDFISLIYETAVQPDQWQELVARLARRLNSNTGIFSLEKVDHSQVLSDASVGFSDKELKAYSDYYVSKDPWLPALDSLNKQEFFSSVEVYSQKDYLNSEMYCDWGKQVRMEYATGCYLFKEGDVALRMSFQRSRLEGGYDKSEVDFLNRLVPHLQKAIAIQNRINDLSVSKASTEALLDKLGCACAVVDEKMSLHYFNEEFTDLSARYQKAIVVRENKLMFNPPKLRDQLNKMVKDCLLSLSVVGGEMYGSSGTSIVEWGLEIDVSPFSSNAVTLGVVHRRMFALVIIKDQAKGVQLSKSFLKKGYGLTEKESSVAFFLSQGKSLNEISIVEGISLNTVKTHVKRIFEKTETNSQNQLISLLLGGLAQFK